MRVELPGPETLALAACDAGRLPFLPWWAPAQVGEARSRASHHISGAAD